MGKKKKQLSQAEVWDDSALLQSWDDALAEYKLYHSIHARGERIEDVIRDVESKERGGDAQASSWQAAAGMRINAVLVDELEDGELEEDIEGTDDVRASHNIDNLHKIPDRELDRMQSLHNTTYPEEKSLMPDAVVGDSEAPAPIPGNTSERVTIPGGVKDEALKNLIMSWYYTGYYTGLYEGQQQAQHSLSS